jgi:hypothetical protein
MIDELVPHTLIVGVVAFAIVAATFVFKYNVGEQELRKAGCIAQKEVSR